MRRTLSIILAVSAICIPVARAEAGLGALLSHSVKAAAGRFRSLLGKTTKAAKTSVKTGTKTARNSAGAAISRLSSKPGGVVTRSTKGASQTVLNRLGVSGMATMARLPPQQTTRLAQLSADLAASPHRAEWLSLISRHGSRCLDFLWDNKASIAVASGASAVLLSPDAFLEAVGDVATTGVDAAGRYIVKPTIDHAAERIAKPVVESTISGIRESFNRHGLWNVVLIALFVIAAGKLHALRRR